jgi:O-antigen ligase
LGSGQIDDLGVLLTGDAYRLEGWIAALRMWASAPLTGFGALSFRELAPEFGSTYVTAPHNELLRLLAEGGIGVAAIFVTFVVVTARLLWRLRTPLSLGALGALVGLIIGGMFNNPFIYIQVMAPCFAVIGSAIGRPDAFGAAMGPSRDSHGNGRRSRSPSASPGIVQDPPDPDASADQARMHARLATTGGRGSA